MFGSLGGYLWDYGGHEQDIFVNVHLYTTAKVSFQVEEHAIVFEQKSNWPWEGNIMFQLEAPPSAKTIVRLRIPAWAKDKFTVRSIRPCYGVESAGIVSGTNLPFSLLRPWNQPQSRMATWRSHHHIPRSTRPLVYRSMALNPDTWPPIPIQISIR